MNDQEFAAELRRRRIGPAVELPSSSLFERTQRACQCTCCWHGYDVKGGASDGDDD